ncbi:hypothetical protein [Phyllobacterium myrsinacearum]|uniref:Uncharacterized protein n=1 Tax=Phyllobacterium myrsinacearum TaxID=28101 RepID=A0A2S9JBN2_9HYPH|nr:hypothetical protein [Phyllobacterium myrsinacearum]PRD50216.1 hypothetical protein C5750_23160 [Phyllobacterium myrsinacearum]PWV90723.1 hypothetical protein DEV92_10666 [Phyllobacterium myrsinacearum]RZU97124.1 hypothetical protein EV654_4702 [Phyllobacterium myrsinacearum]
MIDPSDVNRDAETIVLTLDNNLASTEHKYPSVDQACMAIPQLRDVSRIYINGDTPIEATEFVQLCAILDKGPAIRS